MKIPCSLTVILLLFPLLVNAYTWQFTSPPSQCGNVTLSIQGSGGQPPYSLLIIPTGPSPLPNTEVRTVLNIPFSGTSTTASFNLNYPGNSSFVAVVSDKSGFGTGGASTSTTVLPSSDSSCYSISKPTKLPWFFYFQPTGGLAQCESVRLWWQAPLVNGTVNFYGTIPGGTSFPIPQGPLSSNSDTGTGFDWIVNIAGGTNVLLIANDNQGFGSGGWAGVSIASAENNSCLNNNSPSSTPGNPAGSYPTSTSGSPNPTSNGSNGSHSSSSSNTGAIIGGAVGAAVLLVSAGLVVFWIARRRSYPAFSQQRAVNVFQDDEDGNEGHDFPRNYVTEPYFSPGPTTRGTSEPTSTYDRPLSMSTVTADARRSQTPMTQTTTTRTSAAFPAVNIIRHDDAGPSENLSGQAESETIELPPAYSNICQPQHSPITSSTPTTNKDEL